MISYEQYLQFSPYFADLDVENEQERSVFLEKFAHSSPNVKNFLTSNEIAEKIMVTAKAFGLDDYDTEKIAFGIRKIILGELSISDLGEFLVNQTEIMPDKEQGLIDAISQGIIPLATKKPAPSTSTPEPQTEPEQTKSPPQQADVNPGNVIDLRKK